LTFDTAVAWVPRWRMILWHKWNSPGREAYAYQTDLGDYGKTNPPRGIK
jgi:hypothetical protein